MFLTRVGWQKNISVGWLQVLISHLNVVRALELYGNVYTAAENGYLSFVTFRVIKYGYIHSLFINASDSHILYSIQNSQLNFESEFD